MATTTDRTQDVHWVVVWFKNSFGIDVTATVKDNCVVYHNVLKQIDPKWPDIIDPAAAAKRNKLTAGKKKS